MPIQGIFASQGLAPGAPTIGTATAGDASATVAYTAPTWPGKGNGTVTYTATSSPGSFTGTGASPITVSGLTNGTAYIFTVKATTSYGVTGPSSAASNPVTPAASAVLAYESIQTVTVGAGGQASITFNAIPQTYKHLQIRQIARNTGAFSDIGITVNGSTSISRRHYLVGINSGTIFSGSDTNNSYSATTNNGSTSNSFGLAICDILDYTNTNKFKTTRTLIGVQENTGGNVQYFSGLIQTTSAISSIVLTPNGGNLAQNSQFALYGIKG